jgi:outer membrane protein TolC
MTVRIPLAVAAISLTVVGCTSTSVERLPVAQPSVLPVAHTEQNPPPPAKAEEPKAGPNPPASSSAPPAILGTPASVGGPLELGEVLTAVERHYPLLRAVEQERAIAGGRLLSSLGVFDLNLTAGADGGAGTYDNFRSSAGVSQGLMAGGAGVFANYRTGTGDFPTYSLDRKTADGGEFRAGVSMPLLRDRAIDRPRAGVRQARLDVQIAEPTIARQRLDFTRAAARTYWNWVAAGQRLRVAETLLTLAADRDEQLKGKVEGNVTAKIERTDNQQNIALRNGLLVQAQRAFQQATIELSLFLRNDTGSPTLAGPNRLPAFPDVQPADPLAFDGYLQLAMVNRPEPQRLRLQQEKAAVDLQLAGNQTLPGLNATVSVGQDVGYGKSSLSGPNELDRTTLAAGLAFTLPVQRRDARGRITQAQAQLVQLAAQQQQAEDVIRAEVQDAFSAVERAAEFHKQANARVKLAQQVAEAERALLDAGRSDILRVTLREQAAFEAELTVIGARQDYFRALADLNAAVGIPPR